MKRKLKPKSNYKKAVNINKVAFDTIKIVLTSAVLAILAMMTYFIIKYGWNSFLAWWTGKWGCLVAVIIIIATSLFMWVYSIVKNLKKVTEDE